tara:strand:- start:364 stop:783 length:420 start_codon:yes stop_codon:yes gene_type:complete
MATTTATITLASADLLGDSLSLSSTTTLYDAGTTTGLTQYDSGRVKIPGDNNIYVLLDSTAAAVDKGNRVYIANKNTDETHYVDILIDEAVLGRLYAGDWMFIPWSQADAAANLEVRAPSEVNTVEYAIFHEGRTFTGA